MTDVPKVLPHRHPFLLIDRVLETEPGKWAKGFKNITWNEWFITESHDYMPEMLVIEAMAQLGAFIRTESAHGLGLLSSIKAAEFSGYARPGDRLDLYYEAVRAKKGFSFGKALASVDGREIVKADIGIFIS